MKLVDREIDSAANMNRTAANIVSHVMAYARITSLPVMNAAPKIPKLLIIRPQGVGIMQKYTHPSLIHPVYFTPC